jgi:formylglycine-generating enzyme required for sulfatase activity
MVLVEGEYCTEVRQTCAQWEDPPGTPLARCAKFAPSECVGQRVHKRVCVDRDEYVNPGETVPAGDVSYNGASTICRAQHKRLCQETEWELACEGEQMFPYTTGYERDPSACNFDRVHLADPKTGQLRDMRLPADQLERCTSPFGVRNMSGNLDEWVARERTPGPFHSALKGGWWTAARERCRPATTFHNETFHEIQTGMRCCADPSAD